MKPKRKPASKYTDAFKKAAVDAVLAGERQADVCKRNGLSSGMLSSWVAAAKAARGLPPSIPGKVTAEQRAEAVKELNAGAKATDLAKKLGVSDASVYGWRKLAEGSKPASATINARDAAVYLKKAKAELIAGIRDGRINDLDQSHLLSLLALHSLVNG